MLPIPKHLDLQCYQCGQQIHLSGGYRVFNNKILHDHCYPGYVVSLRRAKRDEKLVQMKT